MPGVSRGPAPTTLGHLTARSPRGVWDHILCGEASVFRTSRSPRGVLAESGTTSCMARPALSEPRGVLAESSRRSHHRNVWPGQHFQ